MIRIYWKIICESVSLTTSIYPDLSILLEQGGRGCLPPFLSGFAVLSDRQQIQGESE
jgi:hypothetical protein